MYLMNKIRYLSWFLLGHLKKDSVLVRLRKIDRLMVDDEAYSEFIEKRLRELMKWAHDSTIFYKNFSPNSLENFPIITKNTVMENYDSFLSSNVDESSLHTMSTSGSTGRPFKIRQDESKRRQVIAEVIYFTRNIGYEIGKHFVYLCNLESGFKKSWVKRYLQNEDILYTRKYDRGSLRYIYEKLKNSENSTTILGYASTLSLIANFMKKRALSLSNISGVISGAETLTKKDRKLISETFGCHVVSRYSNQEMGILAQDYEEDIFVINRASYYVEILKMDSDEPAKEGEIGRVVVTDLYNKAMPMIRYDTGDLAIYKNIINTNKKVLTKVLGRKLDLLYTTKDEPVSFFCFDEFFGNNSNVQQYQLVQKTKTNIIVNLITVDGFMFSEGLVEAEVRKILGDDAVVEVCYLDSVPITSSGKFKYVVNEYKPAS